MNPMNECNYCSTEVGNPPWVIQCAHFNGWMVRIWDFNDGSEDTLGVDGPFTEEALELVLNSCLSNERERELLGQDAYFSNGADAHREFERRCELMTSHFVMEKGA